MFSTCATLRVDLQSGCDEARTFRGLFHVVNSSRWVLYERIHDAENGYLPRAMAMTRSAYTPAIGETVRIFHYVSAMHPESQVAFSAMITSHDGTRIYAKSWLLCTVYKFGPAPLFEYQGRGKFNFEHLVVGDGVSGLSPMGLSPMEPPSSILAVGGEQPASQSRVQFRLSDVDQMGHVNGLRYVDLLVSASMSSLPNQAENRATSFAVFFIKPCFAREDLGLNIFLSKDIACTLRGPGGEARTLSLLRFSPEAAGGGENRLAWDSRLLSSALAAKSARPLGLHNGGGKMFQRRYFVDFYESTGNPVDSYVTLTFKLSVCIAQHALLVIRKELESSVDFHPGRFSVHLSARPTGQALVTVRAWITNLSSSSMECGFAVCSSRTGQALASGMLALSCRDSATKKRQAVGWHPIARDFHGPKFVPVVSVRHRGLAKQAVCPDYAVQVRPSDVGEEGVLDVAGLISMVCSARGPTPSKEGDDEEWRAELLVDAHVGDWLVVTEQHQALGPMSRCFHVQKQNRLMARAWVLARGSRLPALDRELNVGTVDSPSDEPLVVLIGSSLLSSAHPRI